MKITDWSYFSNVASTAGSSSVFLKASCRRGVSVEALSPRDVIRQSLQAGLIQDGNVWTEAQLHRNMPSHTYDEALGITVYSFVRGQGVSLLRSLANTASSWHE